MPEKAEFKPGNRKFTQGVGRRKSASAQARLYPKGEGKFIVNEKPAEEHFQNKVLVDRAFEVLRSQNMADTHDVTVHVQGGGKKGQADAVRLAIARAVVSTDEALRPVIKKEGFLSRDPRVKERKKYGLKRARRSPQWSKR